MPRILLLSQQLSHDTAYCIWVLGLLCGETSYEKFSEINFVDSFSAFNSAFICHRSFYGRKQRKKFSLSLGKFQTLIDNFNRFAPSEKYCTNNNIDDITYGKRMDDRQGLGTLEKDNENFLRIVRKLLENYFRSF